jgi:hypothetical protein
MSYGTIISQYINEVCFSLAQESVLVIGKLAKKFPERINAALMLFTSIINNGKSYLFDNVAVAMKEIFISLEPKQSKELEDLFLTMDKLAEAIKGEPAQKSILWLLARFCERIDISVYLIESYVNQLEEYDNPKSEALKLEVR